MNYTFSLPNISNTEESNEILMENLFNKVINGIYVYLYEINKIIKN